MKQKRKIDPSSKRYHLEITKVQILCIVGFLTLILLWMFILGVLAGRGVIFRKVSWFNGSHDNKVTVQDKLPEKKVVNKTPHQELSPEIIEKQLNFFHELGKVKEEKVKKTSEHLVKKKNGEKLERQRGKQGISLAAKTSHPVKPGGYFVQVASFRKRYMAKKMVLELSKFGFRTSIERVQLKGKMIWFRVLSKRFKDLKCADQYARSLRNKFNISPLVIRSR